MTTDRDQGASPSNGFEWISCPLCGSTRSTEYLKGRDRVHAIPGSFTLVRCLNCRLVYQNPRPTAGQLERHYPRSYFPYQGPRRTLLKTLGWRHGYEQYRRCRFVAKYKKSGRLLDVGCAGGAFLGSISGFGDWEWLWGMEMDPFAAARSRRSGHDVVIARAEEFALPPSTFDVVCLWDVLEHLPDPLARLQDVRASLAPGGMLFLSVPNLASLDAQLFGDCWIGLDLPRHLQVPSRTTIQLLLDRAGFEVAGVSFPTGSHYSFVASLELLVRERLDDSPAARKLCSLFWSGAAKALLAPYLLLVERLGRGAAISVAARPATPSHPR